MLGNIHSVEKFSTIDGPGIRYVVFMQGCQLRCKFCHNPDTWEKKGKEISSDALLEDILKGSNYYKNSNGGVTFSGGEPLLQIDFLIEMCKKLKQYNVNIAIDTSGNFDVVDKKINLLFKYVDLIILDIKHIKSEKHKYLTGFDNTKVLNFAKYIDSNDIKFWIRIVYIPGITDVDNSIDEYKEFISKLNNVLKVEVLPYHELGKFKWKKLGLKYQLENQRIPTNSECMQIQKRIFENRD